jgi:hypothetical protein
MYVTCPHCARAVEFSSERPRFCSFCGRALARSVDDAPTQAQPPADLLTGDFHPADTPTVAPAGESRADVPEQIGGYRLVRRLGGGGMGSVYQAEHLASGQKVALKLINPDFARSPQAVERFRQEGRLASAIIHPRCVFVLAADEEAGQPYIVMELMPGTTLADLVDAGGPLAYPEAVRKILDVISGLQEAHRLDVIHRDVKPSNCFVDTDGRVKVGDFGLAKSVSDDDQLTRTGAFLGTPLFSSPEQIKRQPVTAQTDVYSVCATLYNLLTGQAPFASGGDTMATVARIVSDDPPPPRRLKPDIPKSLEKIVLRGLERDPDRRFPDLEALRRALLPYLPGRLSFGGLAIRLAAYLVDTAVLLVLTLLVTAAVRASFAKFDNPAQIYETTKLRAAEEFLVGLGIHLLYYGVLEGVFGAAAGKRLARLRVCTAAGVDPPGLARGLLRALAYYVLLDFGTGAAVLLLPLARALGGSDPGVVGLITLLSRAGVVVGAALILSTMRKRNGYRGLHEFLSGTRVVLWPAPKRKRNYACPKYHLEASRPPGLPPRVGPFAIRAAAHWTDTEKMLVGEDESLRRPVWVWVRPRSEPAVNPRRRDLSRASRLRWVTSGSDEHWRWDAYLAPRGTPLPVVVATLGRFAWADALPILEQLSEELATACRERTLPATLNIQQVLLDAAGRVQLLGTRLDSDATDDDAPPEAVGRSDAERSLSLLGQTAALLLEGKPRAADALDRPLRAPLPAYAAEPLNRLLNSRDPHSGPAAFRTALAKLRELPVEVPRARRFLHAAGVAAAASFLVLGTLFTPVFASPMIPIYRAVATELAADNLDRLARRDALALLSPDPVPFTRAAVAFQYDRDAGTVDRLRRLQTRDRRVLAERDQWSIGWLRRTRQQQQQGVREEWSTLSPDRDARVLAQTELADTEQADNYFAAQAFAALTILTIIWTIWAWLTRGGVALRLAGLALVRTDGRKASRWLCAWRALLFWLPVVALFGASVWLDATYWAHWDEWSPRGVGRWMLWWSWALWLAGFALAPLYLALAVWTPDRAPHDRLAGTWLVPR